MANKVVLSQDDCAPDALEYFKKDFEKMFGDFDLFMKESSFEQIDEWTHCHTLGNIKVYWSGDFPFYSVVDTSKN